MEGELRIEYVPLDEIVRWPRNPKGHDEREIAASVRRFGFVQPILRDEATGRLVAGHGRLEVLQELRRADPDRAPRNIRVGSDGAWLVPVTCGAAFSSEAEAEAYLLADNRLVELGGWDDTELRDMVRDLHAASVSFEGTGFDPEELLATLDDELGPEPAEGGEDRSVDEIPEPGRKEVVTKPGDLWRLGDHVLLCGDSTKDEEVDRVVAALGAEVKLVLTDPPYANYGSSTGISADIADGKMVRPFFEAVFRQAYRVLPWLGDAYVHTDWRSWAAMWEAARRAGMTPKNCVVWDKGAQGLGSSYANCHEFVGFFRKLRPLKAMKSSESQGQRMIHRPNIVRHGRVRGEERHHNAAKPVEVLAEFIRNSSDAEGDGVVDLFGGSGSTMVAAERTGRACATVEIEPRWCDVVVERWERLTGGKATRGDSPGKPRRRRRK